jgi:hypothetical protein
MPFSEIIEAMQIFQKYGEVDYPFHCEHDELTVVVDPAKVSKEDRKRLKELGFEKDKENDCFYSFKYGSC